MAIVTQFLTGFEHGFVGTAATAGTGLFDTVSSGITASTSSPRNGSYCCHVVAPTSTVCKIEKAYPGTGSTKGLLRFGVKVTSRPATTGTIAGFRPTSGFAPVQVQITSAGVLQILPANGTIITGPTIDTTSWHLIEVQVDTVAKTVDWKVDGVLQTRGTATGTVGTCDFVHLGTGATGFSGFTADYDDWIFGNWTVAATDWYGDGKVLGQVAGVDGTHATITSLSPGDAGTAYSGTPTTVNTMVDDAPGTGGWTATRSTTDNIALRTATVGAYAEILPATTAETGSANAVRAIMSYSSSTTSANLAACDVRNSAGAVTALNGTTGGTGAAYNVTANNFKGGIVTAPAAGWTAAEVNAVRFRFGGCTSADISPVPTVQAMMLEVDWPIVSGPQTFPRTASDAVTLSDTVLGDAQVAPRTAADTMALSDAAVRAAAARIRTAADSWSVADSVTGLVQTYSDIILATAGLVSYWRLGESSGQALDSKGTNPSTGVGSGLVRNAPGLLTGDANGAVQNTGATNSYVNIPTSASLDVTTQATVEVWVKPTVIAAGALPYVIDRGIDSTWFIRHYSAGDQRWEFNFFDSAGLGMTQATNSPNLAYVGVRQHLMMTYDSAVGMRAYLNGVQVVSKPATANPNLKTGGAICIGDRSIGSDNGVKGVVDEVAFYNVALTQQQALDHYNAGVRSAIKDIGRIIATTITVSDSAAVISKGVSRPVADSWAVSDAGVESTGVQQTATDFIPLSDWAGPQAVPSNTTLIDDFNRSNGLISAGAGSAIWTGIEVFTTSATTLGIDTNQLGNNFGKALSVAQFGPDIDLLVDAPVTNGGYLTFSLYYNIASGGTTSANGYVVGYDPFSMGWYAGTFSGGSKTFSTFALGVGVGPIPQDGDRIWIAKRGNFHTLYLKRGTAPWMAVASGFDSSYNRVGKIGIEISGSSPRLDNLSGGTGPTSFTKTASDSVAVSDIAVRAAATRTRPVVDAVVLSDAVARTAAKARTTSDTVATLSDTAARAAAARVRTAVDLVSTSDAVVRAAAVRLRTAADTFALFDSVARTVTTPRPVVDSVAVSDVATGVLTPGTVSLVRTASDSWTVSDSGLGGFAVRDFDGADDVIKFTAPTYWGTGTNLTYVAVVKRDNTTGWHGILSVGKAVSTDQFPYQVFELSGPSETPEVLEYVERNGGGSPQTHHARCNALGIDNTNWMLVAVSVTNNGSTPPRFHKYDGTTWTHVDTTTTISGGSAFSGPDDWTVDTPEFRIGNWNAVWNFFDGKIAVVAQWIGSALSDSQIQALAGGTKADWAAAGAAHLWELGQASVATPVTDYIGSLNQTSIVGTSAVTGDLPSTGLYSFGAASPARVVALVRPAADTVALSDAVARIVTTPRPVVDTVAVSDVATGVVIHGFVRTASDSWTVSDTGAGAAVVRGLDGADDVIRFPTPAYTTAFTHVAVLKRAAPGTDYDGVLSIGAGGTPDIVTEFTPGTGQAIETFINGVGNFGHSLAVHNTTDWVLLAVTHASGGDIRFHSYDSSTWRHNSSGGSGGDPGNWVSLGGRELRFGNYNASFNFFQGSMAVQAWWEGTALSDSAVEALAGGTKAGWAAAGASHLWELSQASVATAVTDYVGSLNQTSIVGTTAVSGDPPPTGLYNFGAASPARVVSLLRPAADSWSVSDAVARAPAARPRTASDSWTVSDAAVRTPAARPRTAIDTVALFDVAVRAPATRARTATDSVSVSDAAVAIALVRLPLASSSAVATGTLSLTTGAAAPAVLPLAASSATASASVAVRAPTQVPLASSSAVATASIALLAPAQVPLQAGSATATGTLNLFVPGVAFISITGSASASGTVALTAPAQVTFNAGAVVATGTLAITAPARLSLSATATATATLALVGPGALVLTSSAQATATLTLVGPAVVAASSTATATGTLALKAPAFLTLGTSSAVAMGSASVTITQSLALSSSTANASGSLLLIGIPKLGMSGSATATGTLSLLLRANLILSGSAQATGTFDLFVPAVVPGTLPLAPSTAQATGILLPQVVVHLDLSATAQASGSLVVISLSVLEKHERLYLEVIERGLSLTTMITEGHLHLLVNDPGVSPQMVASVDERAFTVAVSDMSMRIQVSEDLDLRASVNMPLSNHVEVEE